MHPKFADLALAPLPHSLVETVECGLGDAIEALLGGLQLSQTRCLAEHSSHLDTPLGQKLVAVSLDFALDVFHDAVVRLLH